MISKHLVKYVLTAAVRDKLVMTLVLMVLIVAAVSVFMGSASVTEPDSFALVFGAGGLRILGVTGIVLFCCFYIRRSFESKEVEFLLSRPISRLTFLFSHAAAFSMLAFFIAGVITLTVYMVGKPDAIGLAVWGASLAVELSLIAVAGLFFSMVLSSAAGSALAVLGFYILSRMMGTLLGIMALPAADWISAILGSALKLISVIIPRLDLVTQTSWLVYGVEGTGGIKFMQGPADYSYKVMEHLGLGGFIGLQGILCIALLLAASSYDFLRRQF